MAWHHFGRGLEGILGRVVSMKHCLRLCRRAAGDSLRWIIYAQILSLHTCACLSESVCEPSVWDGAFTFVKKKNNVYLSVCVYSLCA